MKKKLKSKKTKKVLLTAILPLNCHILKDCMAVKYSHKKVPL